MSICISCSLQEAESVATPGIKTDTGSIQEVSDSSSSAHRVAVPNANHGASDLNFRVRENSLRFALRGRVRRLWSREASISDELLMQPADLYAFESTLLLSDFSGSRIVALDLNSGDVRWTFGRAGDGPGEFRGRIGFAGRIQDTAIVWNWSTRRLTRVAPSGALVGTMSVRARAIATSLCVLEDGTLIGNKFMGQDAAMIATISPDGNEVVRLDSLPWPELRRIPPMASQFTLHPLQDGTCMLAAAYWSGAVRIGVDGSTRDSVHLIERVPVPSAWLKEVTVKPEADPRVGSRPRSGISSRLSDSTVSSTADVAELFEHFVIAFDGATEHKGRVLDFYNKRSGKYAGSLETAGRIRYLAGVGKILVVITENDIRFVSDGRVRGQCVSMTSLDERYHLGRRAAQRDSAKQRSRPAHRNALSEAMRR